MFTTGGQWLLFSDQPDKYFMALRCIGFVEGSTTWPKSQSFINVFATTESDEFDYRPGLAALGLTNSEGMSVYIDEQKPS